MVKSRKIVFILLQVCFLFSLTAWADDPGSEIRTIGRITTVGNYRITDVEVLAKIRSRVGDVFDPATAAEDTKRVAQTKGVEYSYYNTTVVDGKIKLTFVVVETNLIRAIDFTGKRKFTKKTLTGKLGFRVGDSLDPTIAQRGTKKLLEFYYKKGYAFAQITLEAEKLSLGRVIYNIAEGPRVKISSVEIIGNEKIKTKKLKRALKTKKRRWTLLPAYYTEEKIKKDLAKLQKVYYEKGFLDAGAEVKKQFTRDKTKVQITFRIREGLVYTVNQIKISGAEHFQYEQLQDKLKLAPQQIYSDKKAQSDAKQILKRYRENGFINAKAEHSIKFLTGAKVDIEFQVTQGERFRIGQVSIFGNEQTHDKVIRRILDEYDFIPGQWYNADNARGDGEGYLEKLIKRTALTESATIIPTGTTPGQRDAQINIVEGQTGSVMLGAGIASDSGVIGQLVFEQRNFDITDKPESFTEFITGRAFRGAGQHFRIAVEPGTQVSQYSVSFTEPYLYNKPISLSTAASSYERWRESYDEGRMKGYIGLEKRYKNKWRRSISFRIEDVDVDGIDTDAPQEIIDVKGSNLLAGVRIGIGRDFTDDKFNPTSGYSFEAGLEQLAGDHTFGILNATYRKYKTLYEDLAERKTVLATRFRAATTIGDAPPFEKFYAGGQGSIRGFDYRGVSTRGLQTNVANPERKDPIGSDWVFLAGAEITIPLLAENFAALFFVDSGAIDSGNYRASIGAGIQILIPRWFGPVPMRFELAAPVMKESDDETQVFSFSIGRLF